MLFFTAIGSYPFGDALLFAMHDVVLWTLVGLVAAWKIRPVGESA